MTRSALFAAFVGAAVLWPFPVVRAQDQRPAVVHTPAVPSVPTTPPTRAIAGVGIPTASTLTPAASSYYPPVGSLQPPLAAAELCRSLRGGLSGAEVAQDVRERGFVGTFGEDEAADARAAGASTEFVASLQAGRFTVSPAYARRTAEQAAKGRHVTEANAWRAEASARAQADERENELRRQGQIAAENNRAIAVKEREDKQRFENMKAQADWESRQRQSYNANDGWWYDGRWYAHRSGSRGHYHYY